MIHFLEDEEIYKISEKPNPHLIFLKPKKTSDRLMNMVEEHARFTRGLIGECGNNISLEIRIARKNIHTDALLLRNIVATNIAGKPMNITIRDKESLENAQKNLANQIYTSEHKLLFEIIQEALKQLE